MTTITCKCGCGRTREVRTADVKRGWGKFFDKTCKARHQSRGKTGGYAGSGVSKRKFKRYADEFGGTPQFNRRGEYEGFACSGFSNED
jgi:hypothetical protein